MLSNYFKKVHSWYQENKKDIYTSSVIFLVSLASFGLGRLSVLWPHKEPIQIVQNSEVPVLNNDIDSNTSKRKDSVLGKYVASKSGSVYHYPWCPGALKIKEENKIWFQTKEEAEKRGLKPAANCDGL